MKKFVFATTLLIGLSLAALAADASGKWNASVPGRGGQARDVTFTLKADGDKLTGSMSGGQGGEIAISDGKVTGDNISFVTTIERGGNTIKQSYAGKVEGDEIKFKREGGQGQPIEFTAKRAK